MFFTPGLSHGLLAVVLVKSKVAALVRRTTWHTGAGIHATTAADRQELRGEQAAISRLSLREAISGRPIPLGLLGT